MFVCLPPLTQHFPWVMGVVAAFSPGPEAIDPRSWALD